VPSVGFVVHAAVRVPSVCFPDFVVAYDYHPALLAEPPIGLLQFQLSFDMPSRYLLRRAWPPKRNP